MDFTLTIFKKLLNTLQKQAYLFHPIKDILNDKPGKNIFLRHDVDLLPENALQTAIIEEQAGIKGAYYFRIVPESNDPDIIQKIAELGHEIGYHYEDYVSSKGDTDKAYEQFCRNLEYFRKFYPVKTICMHGSPVSKWDNRDIWKKYNYRKLGIIFEPYLDTDFKQFFYLTDTGRRWDGWKVSVRDKIPQQKYWNEQGFTYHSTSDIINAALKNKLPTNIILTIHPQRWTNHTFPWLKELFFQSLKNPLKYIVTKFRQLN